MVYIAFDPNDEFWQNNSKVIFKNKACNHLRRQIGVFGNVKVHETNLQCTDSVLYYSGHGHNQDGRPMSITNVTLFVQFLIDNQLHVDRIVFLSCHTYNWLCVNYREFIRLLSPQSPTIQIEGSKDPLYMIHIRPIVLKQNNEGHIDFNAIRLTIDEQESQRQVNVEKEIKRRYITQRLSNVYNHDTVWVTANDSDFRTGQYQFSIDLD